MGLEKFRIKNLLVRQCLAELLGTFVLVALGDGSVAQHVLGPLTGNPSFQNFHSVAAGFGFAVAMGVWIAGGVSGGHINPAVTLALATVGKFPPIKVIPYMCAQYIGAFLAAACIYAVYHDALVEACGYADDFKNVTGDCATAGIYASYPAGPWLTTGGAVSDQLFATFIIMVCIMAIVDEKSSMKATKGLAPLCIGMVVFAIGLAYGMNVGFPVNPARDFGPRLFTLMAGYGTETFTEYNYYFWVPWIIPHIGMFLGALTYIALIEAHEPQMEPVETISLQQIELGKTNGGFQAATNK